MILPHRDARLPLRAWSASLFAAGVSGAWSFPWVAPLARLRRPLATEELKSLARSLRRHINSEGGKFTLDLPVPSALPIDFCGKAASVWGPALHNEIKSDFFTAVGDAVMCRITPPVIGCALVNEYPMNSKDGASRSITEEGEQGDNLPAPPEITFRAAALANMIYREQGGNYFEWHIGPLHWLPKK